ncbi:MAG TPA: protein translocase subunit SecD [Thermoflexia bacterium]|nr:MAG: protein translocase subunit SecD [Chloroflexota bacterium]HEY66914.1 protein translocase subunit SecD [Thermoflexia bacterium]
MKKSETWQLVVIILLALAALYVDLNIEHPDWVRSLLFWRPADQRDIALRLGLDLQGGLQVLLAADVPEGQELDAASMETARRIVENRVNSLGLTEPVVQAQGERRIIVELPGIENPEQAVETIKGTALLEFVDAGYIPLPPDTVITTTMGGPQLISPGAEVTPTTPLTPTAEVGPVAGSELTPTTELSPTAESPVTSTQPALPTSPGPVIYETILTGADLENVGLDRTQQGEYIIPFQLKPDAAQVFADYTASHVGQYLCIVLDKTVISCPVIREPIPGGRGSISGKFTFDEARQLAIQLRYGALPVPLRVESFNRIGATLGVESVQRSVRAGVIGLVVVLLFMLIYYRLLGGLADVALIIYVLLNFALYKLAPITLTLPGIAGFILSAGMAVDANILIFERMKEELRRGRGMMTAIEIGFRRAWPSIRDGQLSTLIICAILFFFGTNFGASMVKGFAITLAIGTVINVFTAVFATRVFVRQVAVSASRWVSEHMWLLGV